MAQNDDAFAAKLAAIRESYVNESLPDQLRDVDEAGQRFLKAEDAAGISELIHDLHSTTHKLAGSSGTFGLSELSVVARDLSNFTDESGPITIDNYQDHQNAVREMLSELEKKSNQD